MMHELPKIQPKRTRIPRFFRPSCWRAKKMNRQLSGVLGCKELEDLMSVEGHLNVKEILTFYYYVHYPPVKGTIVEIGSFKGKSTIVMATALKKAGRRETITAIDPHVNTRQAEVVPEYSESESYSIFLKNLETYQVGDYVQPIRSTSQEAVKQWDQPIGLLFVDGSHKYEDVLLDIQLWEPWVIRGGILVFHDTGTDHLPGVNRAIQEKVVSSGRFRELLRLSNMTVFQKKA